MTCDVKHCGMPIDPGGFVCVVCGDLLCKRHAGLCADLKCCENCSAQCASCTCVLPANQGADVGDEWLCSTCLNGAAVLNVELGPLDIELLGREFAA